METKDAKTTSIGQHALELNGGKKNGLAKTSESKLPSIADLYADTELAFKNNQLSALLNQQPKPEWFKPHPTAKIEVVKEDGSKVKVAAKYMPIERTEWLLTMIFTKWKVEVKWSQLIANSVEVCVRLHYLDPTTGQWEWQDGLGAVALQIDKDKGATEFNHIKSAAVQMAAPAAESYAIKDAAEKLGRLFGKDVNRQGNANYDMLVTRFDKEERFGKYLQKDNE